MKNSRLNFFFPRRYTTQFEKCNDEIEKKKKIIDIDAFLYNNCYCAICMKVI